MNFGESLAYWYLRLNGFFPLMNFVLHRHEAHRHDADADLLAVRFPYVSEPIGGQEEDWDHERFVEWGLNHRENTLCLIDEVKTGKVVPGALERSFSRERLAIAVQRFGVHPPDIGNELVNDLCSDAVVTRGNVTYAKLLISSDGRGGDDVRCCRMTLRESVTFVQKRMTKYRDPKRASRMFFPGDLIQYFAWEAGLAVVDVPPERVEG